MGPERYRIIDKVEILEKKMAASVPVFDHEIIFEQLALTKSQFEVVRTICSTAMNTEEIALLRGGSPRTISDHLYTVYKKLGIDVKSKNQNKIRLIGRLIELGALKYEPVIDTSSCSIAKLNGK